MRKLGKALLFFLAGFLLAGLLSAKTFAQAPWTVTIRVYVYDRVSLAPIEGAAVLFNPPGFVRSTDSNGFVRETITTSQDRINVSAEAPFYISSHTEFVSRPSAGQTVTIRFYLQKDTGPAQPQPPEPGPGAGEPICALPPPQPVNLCRLEGIEDPNPNDTICCPPIVTQLSAVDHIENVDYLPCGVQVGQGDPIGCGGISGYCIDQRDGSRGQWCDNLNWCDTVGGCNRSCCGQDSDCPGERCNFPNGFCQTGTSCNPGERIEPWPYCRAAGPDPCYEWRSATVSRQIGITLLHPYLNELWRLTTNVPAGFFNILRPNARPRFEDIEGKSQIRYRASGVDIFPSIGDFFFPHLGGIQRAKEEAVRTVTPREAIGR